MILADYDIVGLSTIRSKCVSQMKCFTVFFARYTDVELRAGENEGKYMKLGVKEVYPVRKLPAVE